MRTSITPLRIARWATVLTLSGYALIFLLWRGRQVSRIFSESFIATLWRTFGGTWQSYFLAEGISKTYLTFLIILFAITATGAVAAALLRPPILSRYRIPVIILFSLCGLVILLAALSSTFSSYFHFNTLIEYGVRIYIPFLAMIHLVSSDDPGKRVLLTLKILLALTFTAHGLYAMGAFPVPSNFLMMTSSILHTGRDGSLTFLLIAGVLDIAASLAIFSRRTQRFALLYMVFWGFLTALARPVAYYGTLEFNDFLIQWIPQFLIRAGHFLMPFYLLIAIPKRQEASKQIKN